MEAATTHTDIHFKSRSDHLGTCVSNVSSNRKINKNNEVCLWLTTFIAVRSRDFGGQSVVEWIYESVGRSGTTRHAIDGRGGFGGFQSLRRMRRARALSQDPTVRKKFSRLAGGEQLNDARAQSARLHALFEAHAAEETDSSAAFAQDRDVARPILASNLINPPRIVRLFLVPWPSPAEAQYGAAQRDAHRDTLLEDRKPVLQNEGVEPMRMISFRLAVGCGTDAPSLLIRCGSAVREEPSRSSRLAYAPAFSMDGSHERICTSSRPHG